MKAGVCSIFSMLLFIQFGGFTVLAYPNQTQARVDSDPPDNKQVLT